MGAAAKRRAPVTVANQLRLGAVFHIQQGQTTITPAAIGGIARNNRVVQRIPFPRFPVRRFASRLVHPRQPPAPRHFRITGIGQIDSQENVIGKTVNQRGDIGPAATDIPDAVNADAAQ